MMEKDDPAGHSVIKAICVAGDVLVRAGPLVVQRQGVVSVSNTCPLVACRPGRADGKHLLLMDMMNRLSVDLTVEAMG
jgi:hypothetical protein